MASLDPAVEAVSILRDRIITDKAVRDGFIASIESALNEAKPYTSEHKLAESILRRMAGLEDMDGRN